MRNGDFSLEVVPADGGRVRELDSGHVLARPGQVYRLRLRNHGPLHCVVDVDVDGQRVTAGGLVLAPWSTTDLERPVTGDDGRFTVFAEGNEAVFGPDGGRDDPKLGLVEASFRRELPRGDREAELPPTFVPRPLSVPFPDPTPFPEWRELDDSEVTRLLDQLSGPLPDDPAGVRVVRRSLGLHGVEPASGMLALPGVTTPPPAIERAAGTGLTGHSDQRFVPITLGPLEAEATVLRLRIVIGSEEAIAAEPPRPLGEHPAPARPAARP